VALHWAEVPASVSTSMGDALVSGLVDAATAYEWEVVVVSVAGTAGEVGEGSVSMGVEDGSLVHLEAGGLAVIGGPRKGRKLPSFLEGPALLWSQAMVLKKKVLPEGLLVCWEIQGRVLVVQWW